MPDANSSMEQRAYQRVPVTLPVKYRLFEEEMKIQTVGEWRKNVRQAQTMDISMGGMSIKVGHKLPKESVMRTEISCPDKVDCLTVFTEVIWADEKGAGLQFLMMKPDDMKILKSLLDNASSS